MAEDKNGSAEHIITKWTIWVALDDDGPLEVRNTMFDFSIGAVFEQAMKYCRDEGWNRLEITRVLT